MPATPLDSALYRGLLGDTRVGQLFTDGAEIRAMLLVEGALARAQAAEGLIPETSAQAIHRASLEVAIDPAGLATATGENAVAVPALVTAFRAAMNAPEHAQYIHWGATSQDIHDTALVLRLRQVLSIFEERLTAAAKDLGQLADTHADLPMAGRTYGQNAVPTSFGALAAGWGQPLLAALDDLTELRRTALTVSLSGAAGTLSAMGTAGPAVRAGLARELGLTDPGQSWHATRAPVTRTAACATALTQSLAKMGEDLILLTQTGIGEVRLGTTGGSSTMPQKANPVMPSVLTALARLTAGLNTTLQSAAVHRLQRDGGAWIAEWLTFPQLILATARALTIAGDLARNIAPVPDAMAKNLTAGEGTIFAEALTFALTATLPRPDAQTAVKRLAGEALTSGTPLSKLALRDFPDLDPHLLTPDAQLGQAPAEAHAFAERTRALPSSGPEISPPEA